MQAKQAVTIEPFWNRMPRFFLYPLMPPAVGVIIAAAVIASAGFDWSRLAQLIVLAVSAGPTRGIDAGEIVLPALVFAVGALFVLKYGYDILVRSADGYLSPPPLNADTVLDGYELPFKHLAMLVVLGVVGVAVARVWPNGLQLYSVIATVLQPAIMITLGVERSLIAAVNPAYFARLAVQIGWPYFAVAGLVLLLGSAPGTVVSLVGQNLPASGVVLIAILAQCFFLYVSMHLMGYLIYQYHNRIGFQPASLEGGDDEWEPILGPLREELDSGRYEDAADRLSTLVREYPDHSIWLRQKRHKALKLTNQDRAFVDNGGKLLGELIDANRLRDATEIYIDLTDYDPALRPAREQDYEPLMDMLIQRGEYRRAVRMANGFHRDFPDSSSIPPLYLEVARVFSEYLDRPDKARQVAEFLLERYPDHPAAKRARAIRDMVTS